MNTESQQELEITSPERIPRGPNLTKAEIRTIRRLRREGMSFAEIAEKSGRSIAAICRNTKGIRSSRKKKAKAKAAYIQNGKERPYKGLETTSKKQDSELESLAIHLDDLIDRTATRLSALRVLRESL